MIQLHVLTINVRLVITYLDQSTLASLAEISRRNKILAPQRKSECATHAPATNATPSVIKLSTSIILRPGAALILPTLVLPKPTSLFIPECPFDVASTVGSTCAVLWAFVRAVVANVCVACPMLTCSAPLSRKTRAKPGAGTGTTHVPALQLIVVTFSAPLNRPSESNWLPSVYMRRFIQLKTIEANKIVDVRSYLTRPCNVRLRNDSIRQEIPITR